MFKTIDTNQKDVKLTVFSSDEKKFYGHCKLS